MRSKCKIELLDFDQPPPGFEILSKTAHGREIGSKEKQIDA